MDEQLYRYLVLILLSYVAVFAFVILVELQDLGGLLAAVVLGTVVALTVLAVGEGRV
ncbi:hypothetical protein [Natronobacterium texcoconense]|uniref:Uncharacterized protein n=1 Tax=Natronobacterium texcoconense TaxID=1095778 RepID=A0A1H1F5U7_NATTX|nr:hypothetical protein [Natronobacterium texcoconense]SDQ96375.1 hypothetical protein SAMN04489842_1835 [Natronobacterium texcoconense]